MWRRKREKERLTIVYKIRLIDGGKRKGGVAKKAYPNCISSDLEELYLLYSGYFNFNAKKFILFIFNFLSKKSNVSLREYLYAYDLFEVLAVNLLMEIRQPNGMYV